MHGLTNLKDVTKVYWPAQAAEAIVKNKSGSIYSEMNKNPYEILRQMKQWTKIAKITFHYKTLFQTMKIMNNDDMQKWTNQD